MRILFWSEGFWPSIGGVETISAALTEGLLARGHHIEIVSVEWHRDLQRFDRFEGMRVHRLPMYQALTSRDPDHYLAIQSALSTIARRLQPDVVHCNFQGGHLLFLLRNPTLRPIPRLLSLHTPITEASVPGGSLLLDAIAGADHISACSIALRDDVLSLDPRAAAKITVVHNGLAVPDFEPSPLPDVPRLLCLGRVNEEKGFDLAVRAFAQVAARFPDATLVIAGDGPALPGLRTLATDLGITDRVIECGRVANENVPSLVNEATVGVFPSRWREPFGLVLVETGLMARPVIATRVGGIPEVVEDGETGLLVEPEDVDGLASAMATILGDSEYATRLGQAGRRHAIERFGLDRMVDEYEAIYTGLVGIRA